MDAERIRTQPPASQFEPFPTTLARRPFSIDTPAQLSPPPPGGETDGQNRAHRQPSQRFRTRYPFSTWISPNNFGDFHPNPLMSLLTGNGQIEYPWPADPRTTRITHRCHDIAPPPPRYRLYYSVPVPGRNAPLPRVIHGCRKKKKRTRSGRLWKKRKKKTKRRGYINVSFFLFFCFILFSIFFEFFRIYYVRVDPSWLDYQLAVVLSKKKREGKEKKENGIKFYRRKIEIERETGFSSGRFSNSRNIFACFSFIKFA